MHPFLFLLTLSSSLSAWAHEGHGLEGSHAHATDAWGFLVTIAVLVAMIWMGRK